MALWLRDHGVAVSVAVAVVSTLLGIAVGLGGYHLPWLSRTLFALAAVGVAVLILLMRRPVQGRDLEARFADEEFGGKDLFFPAGSDRDGTAGCSVVLDLGFVLTNSGPLPVAIVDVEVRLLGAWRRELAVLDREITERGAIAVDLSHLVVPRGQSQRYLLRASRDGLAVAVRSRARQIEVLFEVVGAADCRWRIPVSELRRRDVSDLRGRQRFVETLRRRFGWFRR